MPTVTSDFTISWNIHDSWTETLAGAHYLISELSTQNKIGDKAHLCRLILISANHLIEKLFFDLVSEILDASPTSHPTIRNKFEHKSLYSAMREWPQIISGNSAPLDFGVEPLLSADLLRKQRNNSIHKNSESVSLEMARKSLFTAIESCKVIWDYFNPNTDFKYNGFLATYPVECSGHYSTARNINASP